LIPTNKSDIKKNLKKRIFLFCEIFKWNSLLLLSLLNISSQFARKLINEQNLKFQEFEIQNLSIRLNLNKSSKNLFNYFKKHSETLSPLDSPFLFSTNPPSILLPSFLSPSLKEIFF